MLGRTMLTAAGATTRRLAILCAAILIMALIFVTCFLSSVQYLPADTARWQHRTSKKYPPIFHDEHDGFREAEYAIVDFSASHESKQAAIKKLKQSWTPPSESPQHWPPYGNYDDQDYDPNRWEGFEWDNDFYFNNGVKRMVEQGATLEPYLPYPEYNSPAWNAEWRGEYVACEGARGKLSNESEEDIVHAYDRLPVGFPQARVGIANLIDTDTCFDREGRRAAYGFRNRDNLSDAMLQTNWSVVRWDVLQNQCLASNQHRYHARASLSAIDTPISAASWSMTSSESDAPLQSEGPRYHSRTAFVLRTWTRYDYTEDDIVTIRALITELSLLSGGEYEVFLLVNVKDEHASIWDDEELYRSVLEAYVPREFHGISVLWNEKLLQDWYPEVGSCAVYWHQFMPLQWFAANHPQFDYAWNWETDARYTGNHYHFLEQLGKFAKAAPRKYLWERNARFYFPASHGTYAQWLNDTHGYIEAAVQSGSMATV